jgi:hypothetical protein
MEYIEFSWSLPPKYVMIDWLNTLPGSSPLPGRYLVLEDWPG